MRAFEVRRPLYERTTDNLGVLRDCADLITKNLPGVFKPDQIAFVPGYSLSGLRALVEKYKDTPYAEAVKSLSQHMFMFDNREAIEKSTVMGSYTAKPDQILKIDIAPFMRPKRNDPAWRDERDAQEAAIRQHGGLPLAMVLAKRNADLPIKTFRGILLHELRHLFQSFLYQNYFYADREGENYRVAPVEIDAAWTHHLEEYPTADYPSVSAFVDAVMASFATYKWLTPDQLRHYRRKTARYYFDQHRGDQADHTTLSLADRKEARRKPVRDMILNALAPQKGDYDLRTLPGYDPDARMFFLPQRVFDAARHIVGKDAKTVAGNAPFLYLAIALMLPAEQAKAARNHLTKVNGISFEQALDISDAFADRGFDTQAIKRFLLAHYS